jgi:hypothetical protein
MPIMDAMAPGEELFSCKLLMSGCVEAIRCERLNGMGWRRKSLRVTGRQKQRCLFCVRMVRTDPYGCVGRQKSAARESSCGFRSRRRFLLASVIALEAVPGMTFDTSEPA